MRQFFLSVGIFMSCVISGSDSIAQSWRWAKGGGSTEGVTPAIDERTVDAATDPAGNIYILSIGGMAGDGLTSSTYYISGYTVMGYGGQDIILSSFTCNGDYRWSKVFGGNDIDVPAAIRTDALGGVYVTGYLSSHYVNLHLDTDTAWASGASYKTLFIAKYDTAGTYKWMTMPQPDTAGSASGSTVRALDMDADSAGNLSVMFALSPGAYAGGVYVAPSKGIYILKYDNHGTFTGGTQLDMTFSNLATGGLLMKRDYTLDRYYVTGDAAYILGASFGATPIARSLFIGAFNGAGGVIWQKQNTNINTSGTFGRVAIDDEHNIYLAGSAANTDTFSGYAVSNSLSPYDFGDDVPLIVKLDTNGTRMWAQNGSADGLTYCTLITLSGGQAIAGGSYPGNLKWNSYSADSFGHVINEGYDVFTTCFDRISGNVLRMDSLPSSFSYIEMARAITADKHGNVYVGGNFNGDLLAATDTLNSVGGGSDFFIAKYGADNCNCTTAPVSNFTRSGGLNSIFIYTGTTTGLDSVVWDFGDGGNATGSTVSHTYTTAGHYYVCATTYTDCGNNVYCDTEFIATTSIVGIQNNQLSIYPNPATSIINIEHAHEGSLIRLTNMLEQEVYSGKTLGDKHVVNISYLPAGTYLLHIIQPDGSEAANIILKQ